MRLQNNVLWPVPICLDVSEHVATILKSANPWPRGTRKGFCWG
ncbi:MAG: hypothetical protein R2861_01010 [Desulfobacterales bacterium]